MTKKLYIVYVHTNKTPSKDGIYKKYYGITYRKPEERWGKNGKGYSNKSKNGKYTYFYNAILKYGWDGFEHKILIHGLTKEQAENWEIKLIAHYHTDEDEFGYNGTKGGHSNILNERVRKKISETMINNGTNKGKNNPMYGVRMYGKLNHMYGKCHSEETKQKISMALKGKMTGSKNPFYKKNHTQKTKNKISIKIKERYKNNPHPNETVVICLVDNLIFKTLKECAKYYNLCNNTIIRHCKGKVLNPRFAYYLDINQ